MPLFETLRVTVTSFFTLVALSPTSDWPEDFQKPLPIQDSTTNLPPNTEGYPRFSPPGAPDDFQYRKCWLRNVEEGKQFDINTDYEMFSPRGIDRHYTIDLADGWYSDNGLNFTEAKLFNRTYPGPWIQACWGDHLIVNVTNSLKHNGTSVHWHGIRQGNTTHMDGVNGVTQCPIAPGDYFVYNFTLQQYGSSWYHSHYSVQYADGAAGPLTIHGPSSGDWDEAISPPLIMTDWLNISAFQGIDHSLPRKRDILLNGRGNITRFNGTINQTEIKAPLEVHFQSPRPGQGCKKYLLRVINTSFDTTFVFSIDNHLLQIVSADFVPIQPYHNTSILVGIGQRYNVVVEANPLDKSSPLAKDGNYWIRMEIADCFGQNLPIGSTPTPSSYSEVGILRYDSSSTTNPSSQKWPNIALNCSDETYTSLNPILPWAVAAPSNGEQNAESPHFGEHFEVDFHPKPMPSTYPFANFAMDAGKKGISMRVNYSDPIFLHLDPKDPTSRENDAWRVQYENYTKSDWIYLVLHGQKGQGGKMETTGAHPIHLHGHDFAILEQAQNKEWDPKNMSLKLNNPPRRDVVLLPTDGYVVIAFKADNPGPWLVHCHIAFHISEGLGMQILEDQAGAFKLWPNNSPAIKETLRVCKNWDAWYSDYTHWANKGNCTDKDMAWCFQEDSGV
ncbi:hypothetical protein E8E14_000861 [Neopestalotiopsis sp. 37M]|nr:hypothetical protein E8E14_000861 [Neopestalotiopsis sp. 37M]